jgi:hypothetical protein
MKAKNLEQLYIDQLIKAGVSAAKAEQAARMLTREQLQLISEIWSDWATAFSQIEEETLSPVKKRCLADTSLSSTKNSADSSTV